MNIYKRLLAYIKPYRGRLIIAMVCAQGYALATAMVSAMLYLIINGLSNANEVVINNIPHVPFLQQLHIRFPAKWIPFMMVGIFLLRSLFEYISQYQMASVGIRAVRKVRDDLYHHLVHLSSDFYQKGRTGDFLSRIVNDVGSIQGAITDVITDIVKQPFVILYNIPMVIVWGGRYAFFALMIFPLVAIPITILGKRLRRITKNMQERAADITAFIGESLAGIHVVKAYNREAAEIQRFERINKSVFDYFKRSIKLSLVQRPMIEVMGAVGAAMAVWFALGHLPPDRFGAFVISLFVFYEPLKKISKVNSTIQQSIAAGTRIFEVLDAAPSIQNAPDAHPFAEPVQSVKYEGIGFGYEPSKPVLFDIDFEVKHGEVLAIVGRSGSGKSTLFNLILRFWDPQQGRILLNGRDIRTLTLQSLRETIGVVTQDTILFNATVAENIAYGRPEATPDMIRNAAESAYAHHFIESLPQGYDTNLGERGLKLSGGQRQRIAIARALLKDAPVLVLDEATSHLDTDSERIVQTALEKLMENRTVFVIAHRLSTVQRADRILVLDAGRVVQQGSNEELLSQGGIYKDLYELQFNF